MRIERPSLPLILALTLVAPLSFPPSQVAAEGERRDTRGAAPITRNDILLASIVMEDVLISSITAIDTRSSVVTAREVRTGRTVQFTVREPTRLRALRVGEAVYVNPKTMRVWLGREHRDEIDVLSVQQATSPR